MSPYLSQAKDFVTDVISMQPVYTQTCMKSAEDSVKLKLGAMKVVAAKCRNCTACAGQGFKRAPFVNDTCPMPANFVGILPDFIKSIISILNRIEGDWEKFRDETIQKFTYLDKKSFMSILKYQQIEPILKRFAGSINFNTGAMNILVIWDFYRKFGGQLMNFYNVLLVSIQTLPIKSIS